jgi:hypothetical protein
VTDDSGVGEDVRVSVPGAEAAARYGEVSQARSETTAPRSQRRWSRLAITPQGGGQRTGRWLLWIGLFILCFLPPLLSQSGRYVADSKLPVWTAPTRYIADSVHVWQSNPYLGNEQHDGIVFPMAAFVAGVRGLGAPVWLAERLWHGGLLFVAAAGMVLLVDLFSKRTLSLAQPVAAIAFAFNPYTLGFGLHGSAAFVPYAILPMLLLAWIRGLKEPRGWLWPAAVGLLVFCMGGGNGAPQVFVLFPLFAYFLWAVFVERSVTPGPAVLFAVRAGALAVALNLWWLVGLTTQGVANDIAYSEQPSVINVASSFSESLRLLGFWGYYGLDRFGPWYPSMQSYLISPLLVVGSLALAVVAVAGAWLSRWRYRALFVLMAVAGVVVMAGIYPVGDLTPYGRALLRAYDSIPGLTGLRTTYKFAGTLALSLSLLAGFGATAGWHWMRARRRWRALAPLALLPLALGLFAGGWPAFTGSLYPAFRSTQSIPEYWQDAVASLERGVGDGRVYFAPGALFSYYAWGGTVGGMAEANSQLPGVRRTALPIMDRYGSNLLASIEQPFQLGPRLPGTTAAMLRMLGVDFVVLQNDLNFARSSTARPSDMQILKTEPGLARESSFGNPGENVPAVGGLTPAERQLAAREGSLAPVEVLRVANATPPLRAESGPPLVMSGDAFGIPSILGAGLMTDGQPLLYSGNLTSDQLAALAGQHPAFVVTDSNRRRAWRFAGVRENFGYTLSADDPTNEVGYGLFGDRPDTKSVTIFSGAAGVSGSGYGSPLVQQPWLRPSQAFDGDRRTAWTVNSLSPVGQWIRVDFLEPLEISQLTLDPYVGAPGTRRLSSVSLEFSDGSTVTRPVGAGPSTVRFAPRTVRWLRVRVAGVRQGPFGGPVGLREVEVAGLSVREEVLVPSDLFETASLTDGGRDLMAVASLDYVFTRAGAGGPLPPEELGIDRVFIVPTERPFDLKGTVQLDAGVSDSDLERLLYGPTAVHVTSSGRAGNNPFDRAGLAMDGNLLTGWTAPGVEGEWLQVDFPPQEVDHFTLHTFTDQRHSPVASVRVSLSDGTRFDRLVPADGVAEISFPSRTVDWMRVTILSGGVPPSLGGTPRPPAGVLEVTIPDVTLRAPRPEFAPLGCYAGTGVTLDGHPISVRALGTPHALLLGQPLSLETCTGAPIVLSPGRHEIRVAGVLQPLRVVLSSPERAESAGSDPPAPPSLSVQRSLSGYRVDVDGATNPFYLVLGENVSRGWRASIGAESLGAPMVVDGYSAGWYVEQQGTYTITVTYAPQARQNVGFLVSLVALPAAMAVLVVGLVRRRRAAKVETEGGG